MKTPQVPALPGMTPLGIKRTIALEDRLDAAKWSHATPIWSAGYGDTLRIVYTNAAEEDYLAYSAKNGYLGPFEGMAEAILATQ